MNSLKEVSEPAVTKQEAISQDQGKSSPISLLRYA